PCSYSITDPSGRTVPSTHLKKPSPSSVGIVRHLASSEGTARPHFAGVAEMNLTDIVRCPSNASRKRSPLSISSPIRALSALAASFNSSQFLSSKSLLTSVSRYANIVQVRHAPALSRNGVDHISVNGLDDGCEPSIVIFHMKFNDKWRR